MSYNGPEDPTYNPFAEHNHHHDRSITSQGFYSSAFFPNLQVVPTLRRRPSSLLVEHNQQPEGQRKKQLRVKPEAQVVPPNTAGLHPLKSALVATIGSVLSDVTRPNLSRVVSEANPPDAPSGHNGESTSKPADVANEERDVIVHQVTSKDSLAGVALKYGITLASLRRANQLWTSDSIHRRSVLYIPIDQATRAREYIQEPTLISLTPDAEDTDNVFEESYSSMPPVNHNHNAEPSNTAVPVTRVPASQLTYFPPSSNKNTDAKQTSPSVGSGTRISPTSSKYDPSLPSNSLTSILTALPIAASTRDEIITRLSFDSVSSSYTDRSRASSNEDLGHELNEVRKPKRFDVGKLRPSFHQDDIDEVSMPTPKGHSQNAPIPLYHQSLRQNRSISDLPISSSLPHSRSLSSTSPPRFYISQPHETHVRTSQLEPEPAMQIPIIRRSSAAVDPSTTTTVKKVQGNLDIERGHVLKEGKTRKGHRKLHSESLGQRMQFEQR